VHYATDVLAGFTAGIVWLLIAIPLLRRLETLIKKRFQRSLQPLEEQPAS
jgi:undecaprenyl-diphosphatase